MKIEKSKILKISAEAIYLFLIFFFCYTATNKLMNLDSFRTNLLKTSLFTEDVTNWFSLVVIGIEIIVIMILIFSKKIGLLILSFLLLIFTLYISFLRFKGLYEVCGCGGILNGLHYKYHLMINILLIMGSLYSFYVFNMTKNEK